MSDRRFYPPRRGPAWVIVGLILLALVRFWQTSQENEAEPTPASLHRVQRVVDGDTLLLTDRQRVRLLGVDTPETKRPDFPVEPWGPEAYEFTRRAVEGRGIRLEFDTERADAHGRILAYVWYRESTRGEEKLLNEELLRAGMGRATLNYPFAEAMKRRFRAAEREAKAAKRGIWSAERPATSRGMLGSQQPGRQPVSGVQ